MIVDVGELWLKPRAQRELETRDKLLMTFRHVKTQRSRDDRIRKTVSVVK